ncbi:MAG: hypothetical protein ACXVB0_12520 [Mucilaginibacter sp.]
MRQNRLVTFSTLLIPAYLLIVACNSHPKPAPGHKTPASIQRNSIKNPEYFNWDSVKLNGKIPMISNFKYVVSRLGKPDKIDTLSEGVNGSYFNRKFQYCYFKGVTFEKYHDTLVFSEIDFSKPTATYLTDGRIRFDSSSKDLDFKKMFPYSFENNELHGTSMDVYEYISLATSRNKSNDAWGFTFHRKNGKLWMIAHDDPYTK